MVNYLTDETGKNKIFENQFLTSAPMNMFTYGIFQLISPSRSAPLVIIALLNFVCWMCIVKLTVCFFLIRFIRLCQFASEVRQRLSHGSTMILIDSTIKLDRSHHLNFIRRTFDHIMILETRFVADFIIYLLVQWLANVYLDVDQLFQKWFSTNPTRKNGNHNNNNNPKLASLVGQVLSCSDAYMQKVRVQNTEQTSSTLTSIPSG